MHVYDKEKLSPAINGTTTTSLVPHESFLPNGTTLDARTTTTTTA
jgi:hypothetical protein